MTNPIKIGIIGDYDPERLSHKATDEALRHCAGHLGIELELQWLPTEALEENTDEIVHHFDGLWCSPGSPYKSMKGAVNAIRFAREQDYPFIGTCGGFQHAVIEYAQNKLGWINAGHAEYDPFSSELFITALCCSLVGETRRILILPNSKVYAIYGKAEVEERYNCSFGLNPEYQRLMDESGFRVAGTDEAGEARILELPQNRFFTATLFQPQLSSSQENPHELILAYLTASKAFHDSRTLL
ncbi:MAG: glutamine amidotransferase [Bacillota bacterium]|nr:glutamine amidotransferase [Bacillota bacterium]